MIETAPVAPNAIPITDEGAAPSALFRLERAIPFRIGLMNRRSSPANRSRLSLVLLGTLAAVLGAGLFVYLGWIGIGLLGLVGLVISQQVDLFGDNPAARFPSSPAVRHSARRQEERSRLRPEEKLAETARRDEQDRFVAVVDTICLSLAALGFGMFFLHQL